MLLVQYLFILQIKPLLFLQKFSGEFKFFLSIIGFFNIAFLNYLSRPCFVVNKPFSFSALFPKLTFWEEQITLSVFKC